jgi:hypothetical protein
MIYTVEEASSNMFVQRITFWFAPVTISCETHIEIRVFLLKEPHITNSLVHSIKYIIDMPQDQLLSFEIFFHAVNIYI